MNHTPGTGYDKAVKLTGTQDAVVGLAKSLEVKAGDVIRMEVFAKYLDVPGNTNTVVPYLASALQAAFGLTPGGEGAAAYQEFQELFNSGPLVVNNDPDEPRAYLGLLYFDENFQNYDFQYTPVTDAAATSDGTGDHEQLLLEFEVPSNGFVFAYFSNESDYIVDVYFDDFSIEHQTLTDAEEDDRYRYAFNGKEKDKSFGRTVYDYGFRIYNPAVSRFLSVDPLTKSFPMLTPYQYASNTPIQAIDLDGLEATRHESDANSSKEKQVLINTSPLLVPEIVPITNSPSPQPVINSGPATPNPIWGAAARFVSAGAVFIGLMLTPHSTNDGENQWLEENNNRRIKEFEYQHLKRLAEKGELAAEDENRFLQLQWEIDGVYEGNKLINDAGATKRRNNFILFSQNWAKGSQTEALLKFAPGIEGEISSDGVKTRYYNPKNNIEVIVDNENPYFRIFDHNRNQYIMADGTVPPTGNRSGKEAKNFVQEQTHILNTDVKE